MLNMGTETVTNIWNITIQNIISLTSLKAKNKKKKKVKLFLNLQGSAIFPCADLCWFSRDWAALLKPLRGRCIPQEGECVSGQSESAHGALLQSRNTPLSSGYHQWGKKQGLLYSRYIYVSLIYSKSCNEQSGGCIFNSQKLYWEHETKTAPMTASHILST